MIFDDGTDEERVKIMDGTILRRDNSWTHGPYRLVDNLGTWSVFRMATDAYSGYRMDLISTWDTLEQAVAGVRADEQRRREEGPDR